MSGSHPESSSADSPLAAALDDAVLAIDRSALPGEET
jgi:hypothetical protein